MTDEQKSRLEHPFPVEDIEFRVLRTNKAKTEGYIAAYVDSRAIQKRLNEVVGWENWQNYLEVTQSASGGAPGPDLCVEQGESAEAGADGLRRSHGILGRAG